MTPNCPRTLRYRAPCASHDKGTCQPGGEVLNSVPKRHQLRAPSSKGAQAYPLWVSTVVLERLPKPLHLKLISTHARILARG